jgi:hypothetical protein
MTSQTASTAETAEAAPSLARRLWAAIEPLHAIVYFDPRQADIARNLGLRGWWMGYFAARFAPLGPIGPEPATAMAYGFAPAMVAKHLPEAWARATPADALQARLDSATAALRSTFTAPDHIDAMTELADRLTEAVQGCWHEGRPLSAGWAGLQLDPAADPITRLWLQTTILREHRGDGHVLAAVGQGLRGLDATITLVATGAVNRSILQDNRGWSDVDWDASVARLQSSGWLTPDGAARRALVEATTDQLAQGPIDQVGLDAIERIIGLAAPLARHLIDQGALPVPNPIGVPRL